MRRIVISLTAGAVLGVGGLMQADVAQAGMFDMMNPSKWFGDNDRYYDRYGYGGPYGRYGYGPYGYGGGPYGWGGGPWGGGPWGGGYGRVPQTIVVNPGAGSQRAAPPPAPRLPE